MHHPGNPAVAGGPRGGRNRPPYIAAINRCQPANTSHPPGPPAGRCKHRPLRRRHPQGVRRPAVPSPAARMPCIVGRAFTPAGEGSRRPERVLVRPCTAPLSRLAPTAPLTGEPFRRQFSQSLPCKGLRSRAPPAAEKARRSRFDGRRAQACFSARRAMRAPQTGRWLRRKAQTEGCIAGLRRRYPANPAEPCPVFRRGRCLHRPGNPAAAQTSKRRAKTPALHCGRKRVLTRKRQPTARPAGGPM